MSASPTNNQIFVTILQGMSAPVTPSPGYNIRILVMLALCALGCTLNVFLVLYALYEWRQKKPGASVWVVRLVARPNGRYIITNTRFLFPLLAVVAYVVVIMSLVWSYRVQILQLSPKGSYIISMAKSIFMIYIAWVWAWGFLQNYIIIDLEKEVLTPFMANMLYAGVGGSTFIAYLIFAIITTVKNEQMLHLSLQMKDLVIELLMKRTPITDFDLTTLNGYLSKIDQITRFVRPFAITNNCILLFCAITISMLSFYSLGIVTFIDSKIMDAVKKLDGTRTRLTTSKSGAETVEQVSGVSEKPTRKEMLSIIRRNANNPRIVHDATMVTNLIGTKRDLIFIYCTVGGALSLAAGIMLAGLILIYAIQLKMTWPVQEALMSLSDWIFSTTTLIPTIFITLNRIQSHWLNHVRKNETANGNTTIVSIPLSYASASNSRKKDDIEDGINGSQILMTSDRHPNILVHTTLEKGVD